MVVVGSENLQKKPLSGDEERLYELFLREMNGSKCINKIISSYLTLLIMIAMQHWKNIGDNHGFNISE